MDEYSYIVSQIIKEQEAIIGPVALEQARKVAGLEVENADTVKISGNAKDVLAHLVEQYAKLFGRASIEICKEAVHDVKTKVAVNDLPEILR
jgi:hypothetical protein